MSREKDGGPAFPLVAFNESGYTTIHNEGMSLRDYFAGQVIAGLMANSDLEASIREMEDKYNLDIEIGKYYPAISYEIADAMIAERNK